MKIRGVGYAVAFGALTLGAVPSYSQHSVASDAERAVDTRRAELLMARLVTVRLERVPLWRAIDAIATSAGVQVQYRHTLVYAYDRPVSYAGEKVPLSVALTRVLANTTLVAVATPEGIVSIEASRTDHARATAGTITGRVTDARTHQPLRGAKVGLDGNDRVGETAEDGTYRLSNVAVGTHTLLVKLIGYGKVVRTVVVQEAQSVSLDVALDAAATALDQIVVTGTVIPTELKAVPNAMTVITAKQIEQRGITRIDQLFRGDVPGLFSMNLGSNSELDAVTMFSRGATALTTSSVPTDPAMGGILTNPIKTYIDGVEMVDSKYLSQIDPASIERIEILTGPQASTLYGANAINGVMQVFTKRGHGNKPQLALNLKTGVVQNNFSSALAPNHLANAILSGMEGRISYSLGSSWNYTGSWTPGKQTQSADANGGGRMEWVKITADASTRRTVTKNKQRGTLDQTTTEWRSTGVWTPSPIQGINTPRNSSLDSRTLGVSVSYRPLSWWSHEAGIGTDSYVTDAAKLAPAFSTRSDTLLTLGPNVTSNSQSLRYNTTLQIPMVALGTLNLTIGGDHQRAKTSSWSASGSVLTSTLPNPFITRDRSKNSGAYAQGQWSVKEALFFTYGIRASWNPNIGDKASVLPGRYGVSLTHDFGSLTAKLRGSYGRSIRPPGNGQKLAQAQTADNLIATFGPYNVVLANPYLLPEHQQGGEGGVELYLGARGSLTVTRYNQTVDNLISVVLGIDSVRSLMPTNNPCSSVFLDSDGHCFIYQRQNVNVGSIRNQGWEAQGSVNLGPVAAQGTYSWTKSRVLGVTPRYRALLSGAAFEPGRPFDYVPEHTWALGLTYTGPSSSISLNANGISQMYMWASDLLQLLANNPQAVRSPVVPPRVQLPSNYRAIGAGYVMSDLNALHRFSSMWDATLQINNLTNYYQNDYSPSFATAGRQTKLGVRVRFQ